MSQNYCKKDSDTKNQQKPKCKLYKLENIKIKGKPGKVKYQKM